MYLADRQTQRHVHNLLCGCKMQWRLSFLPLTGTCSALEALWFVHRIISWLTLTVNLLDEISESGLNSTESSSSFASVWSPFLLSIDQVWRRSTALTWSRWGCRRLADNIWLLAHDNNNNSCGIITVVLLLLQNSFPVWEDFSLKAGRLHAALRLDMIYTFSRCR